MVCPVALADHCQCRTEYDARASVAQARHPGQSLLAYTAPFVGIGWILLHLTNPPAQAMDHTQAVNGLTLAQGLFKGIAQVMLLPHPLAGLLIVIGLWLSNWRAALWAITVH
ncbi:putative ABC transporter membrane protein [Pseudomonas fragi]|uniref:Putative ABC transporter membrane protein n=1 Tax=Pseudomonas fragi TaxID=296 RepID=A0A449IEZ9_PSEFR|nr:putative ABC transporter membrane protein [Pseudomonas fragi]